MLVISQRGGLTMTLKDILLTIGAIIWTVEFYKTPPKHGIWKAVCLIETMLSWLAVLN